MGVGAKEWGGLSYKPASLPQPLPPSMFPSQQMAPSTSLGTKEPGRSLMPHPSSMSPWLTPLASYFYSHPPLAGPQPPTCRSPKHLLRPLQQRPQWMSPPIRITSNQVLPTLLKTQTAGPLPRLPFPGPGARPVGLHCQQVLRCR